MDASACTTEPGAVLHAASGRRLRFGELAAKAAQLPVPAVDQLKLKDPAQFRLVGKDQLRVDNWDKIKPKPNQNPNDPQKSDKPSLADAQPRTNDCLLYTSRCV